MWCDFSQRVNAQVVVLCGTRLLLCVIEFAQTYLQLIHSGTRFTVAQIKIKG